MCYGTEALYIGAALAAAGAATSSYAQHQQLKTQDSIAAAGIIKQGDMQKQGENDVAATTGKLAKSNATTQDQTNKQLSAYRAALQQGAGISGSASPGVPGASKAYKASQGVAGATAGSYVDALAKSAATTEGTQLERVGENQDMAKTATDLGLLNQRSQEENYVTQLKVRATQANPWLTSLGTLMSAAGVAFGGAAGMGSSAAGGGAEAAAEAAGAAGTVGSAADAAGTIALSNPLTGLSAMAAEGAGTASAGAGISAFGAMGSGAGASAFNAAINTANAKKTQSPYITGQ